MSALIKIGQIGVCHEHASAKMDTLRMLKNTFEVVGIVDDRTSSAARFAGEDERAYAGLTRMTEEELFNYPGLQAVVIETANNDLVPTALRCMEHKLPMHMDKPGGENLDDFVRLLEGCRKRELPFQMGYMFRGNPAMQLSIKAVKEQWLGDVFEVQAGMSHGYGGESYQAYLSHFPGGIMFNLGCHLVDFIVAILGRPEAVTPFLKSTKTPENATPNNSKNNCLSIIEYANTIVSLHACDLEADGINQRRLKISGSKGSIELSPLEIIGDTPLTMQLILTEDNSEYAAGTHTISFAARRDRYEEQLLELAHIIKREATAPYSYAHDQLVQEVVLATSAYTQWKK